MYRIENQVQDLVNNKKEEEDIFTKHVNIKPANFKPPLNILKFNFIDNKKCNEVLKELQGKLKGL